MIFRRPFTIENSLDSLNRSAGCLQIFELYASNRHIGKYAGLADRQGRQLKGCLLLCFQTPYFRAFNRPCNSCTLYTPK